MAAGPRVLVVEARFYDDIADHLLKGAVQELTKHGAGYKRIIVPGVLEIPAAIRYAIEAGELRAADARFAGYVALGCAIKGETDHYDHCCAAAMRGVQEMTLRHALALGNGILTCRTRKQAVERALVDGGNFGARAAAACLRMIKVKRALGL